MDDLGVAYFRKLPHEQFVIVTSSASSYDLFFFAMS